MDFFFPLKEKRERRRKETGGNRKRKGRGNKIGVCDYVEGCRVYCSLWRGFL